ncbi:universal stress protein [Nonomuraea rhizosphaerae]|uniref:universal stress protein n=1 Tax=Nonomuraea rhizosphaerae TaxID=2665663 RepID=UPI001C5D0E57|nr:universal stress protein [Nonomuraea rhizosphaerae]
MKLDNVLTGFVPEPRGRDGLALAVVLARQAKARLTVATVQPPAWTTPGPARADLSAWRTYLKEQAGATLGQARDLAGRLDFDGADYVVHTNKGSGRGLVELARLRKADVVVIGPAPGGGRGRVSLGSTADQLLHSSTAPVMLAPRGYADAPCEAFERITVAYRRGPCADAAVRDAAQAALALDVPLRLITLVVRNERRAAVEEDMLARLRDQVTGDLAAAADGQRRHIAATVEVLEGRHVAQALGATSWLPGELLICASSNAGPLRRVFLGDTSLKIVRAATCPVMILTRQP